jgi:hypothetical protein
VKLTASNPAEQRRQLMLLGLLILVALVVWYTQSGGAATEATISTSNPPITATPPATAPASGRGGQAGGGMPEPVRLASLEQVPQQGTAARNPFGFGTPPAPPRPPAPAYVPPPPAPALPPRPVGPPPLPPIPVKFMGFVEDPAHPGKVVALSLNGGVVIAREGDLVDGRYRLVKVGLESIVMAYPDGRGQQTIRLSGS